jgi:hypothetical protein
MESLNFSFANNALCFLITTTPSLDRSITQKKVKEYYMAATTRSISLNDDVIIDTTEAAELLKTPAASLIKWRSTGEHGLPFFRIGRNVRYRTADLRAWIEAHVQGGVSI